MPVSRHRRRPLRGVALLALLGVAVALSAYLFSGGGTVVEAGIAAPLSGAAGNAEEHIPCRSCHLEHQGRDHSLASLSDSRCEACHTDVSGFPSGHPAFESYPYKRRTRINYDHVAHEKKYFPDSEPGDVPKDCASCHEPDSRGQQMLVRGFETTCSACHADAIRGEGIAGAAGIPVITVPGLDLQALRKADAGIGEWPELSDRKLTPFMRAVFAGDPKLKSALERFDQLDPLDLRDAEPADLEAVTKIAWATKRLFYDLLSEGPTALQPKLDAALGGGVDDAAAREMLGGITLATVRAAQNEWFPDLFKDVSMHSNGKPVPIPPSKFGAPAAPAPSESGSGEGSQEDILGGDSGGGSQEDILGGDSGGGSQEDILGGDSGGGSQEDILGGDSGGSGGEDILSGSEDTGSAGSDILGGGAEGAEGTASAPVSDHPPEPNPESWARLGGWYQDYFALLYRPSNHADPFLKRWLDVTAANMGGEAGPVAAPIFDELGASDSPGQCMKCHSADAGSNGTLALNWRAKWNDPDAPHFTRFEHAPHLLQLTDDKGCADCHSYNPDADYLSGFEDQDPTTYMSNFQPLTKESCSKCHVARRAGNACIDCHRYHGGHATEVAEESVQPEE